MSPFRARPPLELGALDTGLERASADAHRKIPRGGRLYSRRVKPLPAHACGAIGSAGLLAMGALAIGAWAGQWFPASAIDVALCGASVLLAGFSLAAVLRAVDRGVGRAGTASAARVGRVARRAARRLGRLASIARTDPDGFGRRHVNALRRALAATRDVDVERWIPADVRGRAQLLLARSIAHGSGPGFERDPIRHREIHVLLDEAALHLTDASPALADLERLGARVAAESAEPLEADDDARIPARTLRP